MSPPFDKAAILYFKKIFESTGLSAVEFSQCTSFGFSSQIFSENVIAALKIYGHKFGKVHEYEPTIKFLTRVRNVIDAMTSRTPLNALRPHNKEFKAIEGFLEYLQDWKYGAEQLQFPFLSDNTYEGWVVTLKAALELCLYLVEHCNYNYLMTSRMLQDILEAFFGLIRSCSGSTDKPDPVLFIQIFRLLTFYSLVKPPRGSNVEGLELFETLLTCKELRKKNETKSEWEKQLDDIIENGEENTLPYGSKHAHDYNVSTPSDFAESYFSGFVMHKVWKWTDCDVCRQTVSKPHGCLERDKMIDTLTKGGLKYSSDQLFDLLRAVEKALMQTVGEDQFHCYTLLNVGRNIMSEGIKFVGCSEHKLTLTGQVIHYYVMARAQIICKKYNKAHDEQRRKERALRKNVKLVGQARKNKTATDSEDKGLEAVGLFQDDA